MVTQQRLEPRKKKSNREKMTLVRVEPMGLSTRNNKRVSRSPNRKIIWHLGVEPTSLSLLSSKSTSESHHKKTKTVELVRLETEETGRIHSPMVFGRKSTEISLK
jgi:hypothetical protein